MPVSNEKSTGGRTINNPWSHVHQLQAPRIQVQNGFSPPHKLVELLHLRNCKWNVTIRLPKGSGWLPNEAFQPGATMRQPRRCVANHVQTVEEVVVSEAICDDLHSASTHMWRQFISKHETWRFFFRTRNKEHPYAVKSWSILVALGVDPHHNQRVTPGSWQGPSCCNSGPDGRASPERSSALEIKEIEPIERYRKLNMCEKNPC